MCKLREITISKEKEKTKDRHNHLLPVTANEKESLHILEKNSTQLFSDRNILDCYLH